MEREFISFDQAAIHEKRRKEERRERIINTICAVALAIMLIAAVYFNIQIGGGL